MDILAARKKAAERAQAVKARETVPEAPASVCAAPELNDRPVPVATSGGTVQADAPLAPGFDAGYPPLPDVTFVPDEPIAPPEKGAAGTTQAAASPAEEQPGEPSTESGSGESRTAPEQDLEMLSFLLGSEEYVVAVDRVREVLTLREVTPVPRTANYLLGVCSLRGTVMPIIDLNIRLGLSAGTRDEKSRIIVVSLGHDDQVGLLVDRVRGVVRFAPSAVQPAPDTVEQGAGADYLKGIARKNDRLYILLDVEKAVGARQDQLHQAMISGGTK